MGWLGGKAKPSTQRAVLSMAFGANAPLSFFPLFFSHSLLAYLLHSARMGRARSPNPFTKSRAHSPFYFLDFCLTRTYLTAHDLSNTLPIISSHKRRRSASLFRLRWARRSQPLNSHLCLSMAWHESRRHISRAAEAEHKCIGGLLMKSEKRPRLIWSSKIEHVIHNSHFMAAKFM